MATSNPTPVSSPIYLLKSGLICFLAAIVLGILEPVMLGFRNMSSSALMNATLVSIGEYGWRGMGLVSIGLIVLGAVGIIRTMDLF